MNGGTIQCDNHVCHLNMHEPSVQPSIGRHMKVEDTHVYEQLETSSSTVTRLGAYPGTASMALDMTAV